MARPKNFDAEQVVDSAIGIFREHGFEGTSADMLVRGMGIGRQSLYDTYGDKWQLYLVSVRRYAFTEAQAHIAAIRSKPRAIDGIVAMIERVVNEASKPCLGVQSTCEFGLTRPELTAIHESATKAIGNALIPRVKEAQREGDLSNDATAEEVAAFIVATFASIRLAARAGMKPQQLQSLQMFALRALR
jgi:TetR/AcrR family transcriptional repressor of nem operon